MKRTILLVIAVAAVMGFVASSIAQDDASMAQDQSQPSETVFGWQLMSEEERTVYRNELRALKTKEERQAFRQAHHEEMQARAAEQGVILAAPQSSRSMGQGRGHGQNSRMRQPVFADFDLDGDGFIGKGEYAKAHAERVAQGAREGRAMKNVGQTTFADIDTDGDGRASREEFAAHQADQRANRQH